MTEFQLKRLQENLRLPLANEQQTTILRHFSGIQNDCPEWTEQDIVSQILNFVKTGLFEKQTFSCKSLELESLSEADIFPF